MTFADVLAHYERRTGKAFGRSADGLYKLTEVGMLLARTANQLNPLARLVRPGARKRVTRNRTIRGHYYTEDEVAKIAVLVMRKGT